MNKIINKFLLTGDKFVLELFSFYSNCGPFTKHRERVQKFRKSDNLKHSYRN